MRNFTYLTVFSFLLVIGYGFGPAQAASPVTSGDDSRPPMITVAQTPSPELPVIFPQQENKSEEEDDEYRNDINDKDAVTIADPLEPFNRAMYSFNDKLYFWILKPVAQGYSKAVPEPARVSVKNFFANLGAPVRVLSCLLQADFSGAATEIGRFGINTLWGIGGLMDPAASKDLNLLKQDADLGQTLGVYGVGQGFYIVWPIFGPSSPRDSVDIAGDYFLYPVSYLSPWYTASGVWSYEVVNATSLRIGDYESLKRAAIDPYVSMRDAYVQYRMKKVEERKAKSLLFKVSDAVNSTPDQLLPQK